MRDAISESAMIGHSDSLCTCRFGKEKSRSSMMITKVDGDTWQKKYTDVMTKFYGGRYQAAKH